MALASYLSEARVSVLEEVSEKDDAIRHVARLLVNESELDEAAVTAVLLERERLATTGVGSGVAIPHGRMDVEGIRASLLVVPGGVPFDAIDGREVQLVLGLLAPAAKPTQLLRTLAEASRLLRDETTRERLIGCPDAFTIMGVLEELA